MKIASILRAGVLGLALAAATVPAQAASVQFHFGIGDGFGFRRPLICIELTDRQIRNAVADQGYSNIYLNVRNDRRIQVRATKGQWVYLLRVSTCTGAILDRDRLRRAS
jgi:hypothetical protein